MTFGRRTPPEVDCAVQLMIWSPPPGQDAEVSASTSLSSNRDALLLLKTRESENIKTNGAENSNPGR